MKKLIISFFASLSFVLSSQTINTTLTYLVNQPSKKTAKPPVLILLHGYGSNENDLFELAKVLSPNFITFSLRGSNPVPNGGSCWYPMQLLANQQFSYNYDDVKLSKAKVLSFISNACKIYHLDSTQVYLLGFSQGAIMAYDIALSAPGKIKGVLALSGRMLEESRLIKTDSLLFAKVKFFIGHGASDNVIKIEEAEKAYTFLKTAKVTELTYKTYEMPHSISGQELNDIKAWLIKALSPEKAQ